MKEKKRFEGKKLLILGASHNEIALVQRAQELGIYTIVTDNRTDTHISKAKNYADEAWYVSWSDLDTLEALCREHRVDGVIGGWSEILVENVIRLCERLGLPCYSNLEQLEITRNKRSFKNACVFNNIPVVREYRIPEEVDVFPVIVKPVDRAGSIGISVANNTQELQSAYEYAMSLSLTKDVIIEQFITDAVKIDAYYLVMEGKILLASTDDVIVGAKNGTSRVVQSGWVLPSRYHDAYVERIDPAVRQMIQNMGIHNGTVFFSGFANEQGYFAMFETGFRLSGENLQEYFCKKGLVNIFDIYIYHALTGSTAELKFGEDVLPNLKNATINLYVTHGVVTKIEGLDMLVARPDFLFSIQPGYIGQHCKDDKAILNKAAMIYYGSESADELAADVAATYATISITDEHGKDMLYDRIDPDVIRKWWGSRRTT